jgi:hypothetical protein
LLFAHTQLSFLFPLGIALPWSDDRASANFRFSLALFGQAPQTSALVWLTLTGFASLGFFGVENVA